MALNVTYKGILQLALPIAAGTFIQFLVVFADNLFLSEIGQNQMNGAGNGSLIYITFLMALIGLASGIQILVARRNGEKNFIEAGAYFSNGLVLAGIISVVVFILMQIMSRYAFPLWISSNEVLMHMQDFVNVRSLGIIIYFIPLIAIGFYTGVARTMVVLYATVMTAGINVVLDYFFIFGIDNFLGIPGFNIPRMEVKGACWATVTAELIATAYVIIYMLRDKKLRRYDIKRQLSKIPLGLCKKNSKDIIPVNVTTDDLSCNLDFFLFNNRKGRRK